MDFPLRVELFLRKFTSGGAALRQILYLNQIEYKAYQPPPFQQRAN